MLDTNAVADCIFQRRGVAFRVRSARLAGHKIWTGVPVLAELFAGIEYSATRDTNTAVLNQNVRLFRLWPFTEDAAREYGRLYAHLRRIGRTIQTVDLMIAAIALTLGGCTVVTSDSDLSGIPGLNVESWATGG
ncbi:type II toxin-antitoxin system VapC family toxin [Frigoriglobus tundricola]|uniref:type II toxin-antitoxin system VapC family toxin n=1 Tax=Frigoriglobus tundricola TaxID=2774151 RepID=UPI0021BC790C|nr:type II toxin-antitoxin system VapC family toxin [Frigoriglobus tundricola]